jgi:hypothetical protein
MHLRYRDHHSYPCIESRRDHPQTVLIGLEVDTACAEPNTTGRVFVRDIEEILRPMGGRFQRPARKQLIDWTEEG